MLIIDLVLFEIEFDWELSVHWSTMIALRKPTNLPVVSAGVHSCSPVAPHSSVNSFDGSTVTIGPAGEWSADVRRLRSEREFIGLIFRSI